jgi:glycosyltransferase involved in cell wall biosynthesis
MLTLAAYTLDLPAYACARLRLVGPAAALAGRVTLRLGAVSDGRDYAISPEAMDGADLIVFQRYFPMAETWPLVEQALGSGRPVVYDLDDNFLALPGDHPMRERLAPVAPYVRKLLARADLVTVSSPELARAFAGITRKTAVLPNFLEEGLWARGGLSRADAAAPAPRDPQSPPGPAGPVRIVFAGTSSHASDLALVAPALARVKERFGEGVEFVFLGCPAPGELQGRGARTLPFGEDYAGYARTLAGLSPDIGIAPLADNPFNRCKSAVKWLEYSALGVPGVYADLPPYAPVRSGATGFKAGGGAPAWERELTRLVEDADLRLRIGHGARAEVLAHWGLRRGAEGYYTVWRRAADAGA